MEGVTFATSASSRKGESAPSGANSNVMTVKETCVRLLGSIVPMKRDRFSFFITRAVVEMPSRFNILARTAGITMLKKIKKTNAAAAANPPAKYPIENGSTKKLKAATAIETRSAGK